MELMSNVLGVFQTSSKRMFTAAMSAPRCSSRIEAFPNFTQCQHKKQKDEEPTDWITCPLPNSTTPSSLVSLLKTTSFEDSVCPQCSSPVVRTRQFYSLPTKPAALLLYISRVGSHGERVFTPVDIPQTLDINGKTVQLFGVVANRHVRSHFVSYIKVRLWEMNS